MNLIWRFLWVILFSRFAPAVKLFDEGSIKLRVLPTDIDVLMHMNNGRYFSMTDLARIDFMIRNKTVPKLRKHRVYPVVASAMIRFRKSLQLFTRFEITTRMIGWDDKFFYIVHHFKYRGEIYALSLIKACCLRKSTGLMKPQDVLALLGVAIDSPPIPTWVKEWQHADQAFHDEAIETHRTHTI